MTEPRTTLHDFRSAAEICREHGWTIGTLIEGDEGYGPHVIRITAIGEQKILAACVSPHVADERSWTLSYRDWHSVAASLAGRRG